MVPLDPCWRGRIGWWQQSTGGVCGDGGVAILPPRTLHSRLRYSRRLRHGHATSSQYTSRIESRAGSAKNDQRVGGEEEGQLGGRLEAKIRQ